MTSHDFVEWRNCFESPQEFRCKIDGSNMFQPCFLLNDRLGDGFPERNPLISPKIWLKVENLWESMIPLTMIIWYNLYSCFSHINFHVWWISQLAMLPEAKWHPLIPSVRLTVGRACICRCVAPRMRRRGSGGRCIRCFSLFLGGQFTTDDPKSSNS